LEGSENSTAQSKAVFRAAGSAFTPLFSEKSLDIKGTVSQKEQHHRLLFRFLDPVMPV